MTDDRKRTSNGPQDFDALVNAESRVMALQESWLEVLVIQRSLIEAQKFIVNGHASAATQCLRDVAQFAEDAARDLHLKLHSFQEEQDHA